MVRCCPLAVEHGARDPFRSLSRVRAYAHRERYLALADAMEEHPGPRVACARACDLSHECLRDQDAAFRNLFAGRARYPRFKRKGASGRLSFPGVRAAWG